MKKLVQARIAGIGMIAALGSLYNQSLPIVVLFGSMILMRGVEHGDSSSHEDSVV